MRQPYTVRTEKRSASCSRVDHIMLMWKCWIERHVHSKVSCKHKSVRHTFCSCVGDGLWLTPTVHGGCYLSSIRSFFVIIGDQWYSSMPSRSAKQICLLLSFSVRTRYNDLHCSMLLELDRASLLRVKCHTSTRIRRPLVGTKLSHRFWLARHFWIHITFTSGFTSGSYEPYDSHFNMTRVSSQF